MRPTLSLLKAGKAARPTGVAAFPRPRPGPTAAAFSLVRQILADRPLHFREILGRGAEALPIAEPAAPAEAESSTAAQKKAGAVKKLNTNPFKPQATIKGQQKSRNALEEIPLSEGHPFVSGNFLKKRIIPTLASIGLIKKRWIAPYPDTELARHSPDKLHVMWEVVAAPSHGAAKWDDVTSDSFNYTQLRRIGSQISKAKDGLAREAEKVKYESGELERDARQVAAWAGRPKGFTTHLERKHLNTRRANARDAKEVHRSELMAEHQAARQAAKEAVEV